MSLGAYDLRIPTGVLQHFLNNSLSLKKKLNFILLKSITGNLWLQLNTYPIPHLELIWNLKLIHLFSHGII